jgi:NIPSNAP
LNDDAFCELRIYRVATGRARDMEARVQGDLRTLFPRHGIRPLAAWSTIASPVAPAFIYLTPWRDMTARSQAWASFYADPDWAEVRARTNAGSELVESFEVLFVRAVVPWTEATPRPAFAELIVQSTAIGRSAAVASELRDQVLPLLTRAGAHVHGAFDLISGRPLPAVATVVGWDSLDQRATALASLDERAQAVRAALGFALLDRAEQHLLQPVKVDWA